MQSAVPFFLKIEVFYSSLCYTGRSDITLSKKKETHKNTKSDVRQLAILFSTAFCAVCMAPTPSWCKQPESSAFGLCMSALSLINFLTGK